ncbi:zinc finger protein 484-like [Pelobates fuscus]|uniref:zinc finger protein 484-like n=1 Tax=Pelobates fuscus TaxID=191477 RepID=UPI002FE4AC62
MENNNCAQSIIPPNSLASNDKECHSHNEDNRLESFFHRKKAVNVLEYSVVMAGEDDTTPSTYSTALVTNCSSDQNDEIISNELMDTDVQRTPLLQSSYDYSNNLGELDNVNRQTSHQKGYREGKSFICSECGMCFDRHSNLLRHEPVHTGERPFVCMECNKSYTQKADLTRHQKSHTALKTYPCRDCGYHFDHKAQLVIHRKAHRGRTQFACAVCGKCFIKHSNLLLHQKVHMEPKPEPKLLECLLCDEKFIHKRDLAKHRRVHTGEKFLCFKCGVRFSCISSLHRHQKIHKKDTATD